MSEAIKDSPLESPDDIRILGLNTDKTRKTYGSDTVYEVYFELSGTPSLAWKDIFKREWKATNPAEEANIDRGFLVMHCSLQEIAAHLLVLKKMLDVTNIKFKEYVREQATQQEHLEDVWNQERKDVEDAAKSLNFD